MKNNKTKRSAITPIILLIMAFLLIFFFFLVQKNEIIEKRAYVLETTLDLVAKQAEIKELIALYHSHASVNLDQVNRLLQSSSKQLNKISPYLQHNEELLQLHKSLDSELVKQFNLISQYKSANSVYFNSINFYPTALENCRSSLTSVQTQQQLTQIFNHILVENIKYKSQIASNGLHNTRKTLTQLVGNQAACKAVIDHTNILNKYHIKRNSIYQELNAQPLKNQILAFYGKYENLMQKIYKQNQIISYSLLAINLLFLLYILRVLNQLTKKNIELLNTHQTLQHQKNIFRALSEANQSILHGESEQEIFQEVTNILHRRLGISSCWVGKLIDHHQIKPVAIAGQKQEIIRNSKISIDPEKEEGQGSISQVYQTKQDVIVNDYINSPLSKPWREDAQKFSLNSVATFPILYENQVYAVLTLYSKHVNFFDKETVLVIHELVDDLALAVEKLELKKHQASQAADLAISAIAFESHEPILIATSDGNIIKVNKAFSDLTGYSEEEVLGQTPRILKSGEETAEFYKELWLTLITKGHWQGELHNRKKDGSIYPIFQHITAVYDNIGQITHFISHGTDLTQRKEDEAKIYYLQNHDKLTGLPNQTLLTERIQQQHDQEAGFYSVLFLVNLSRFKLINQSLGHAAGDELLKQVSQRLKDIQAEEIIEKTVSRIGSDEFAILILTSAKNETTLGHLSQTLLQNVQQKFDPDFVVNEQALPVDIATGITTFNNQTAISPLEIYQQANTALHRAKLNPATDSQFYEESMQAQAVEAFVLEDEIRQAIRNQEFLMHYQPQINTATESFCGAEALIRWQKPNGEIIPPYKFIPILEKTGLIVTVGYWLLEKVLQEMQNLEAFDDGRFTISVNLSPIQLKDEHLVNEITQILRKTAFPSHRLLLEVTESALMENMSSAIAKLSELQALGIQIAIDDFGTGYSSFAYLKNMPVNELKIDKSFLDDLFESNDTAIVKTIIDLAHALNISAIAEGVEEQAQVNHLKTMQCDRIQGYFYSKPLPYKELVHFIANADLTATDSH